MKIEIWELRLYYNFFDILCGKYITIKEKFIPDLNYSINIYNNKINVFKTDNTRYISKNIFCERIKPILLKEYDMDKKEIDFYKKLKKKHIN